MGSRAILVVCRDPEAARERFGVTDGRLGVCYTRTGRDFFSDADLAAAFVGRVSRCLTAAGFWERFDTSWACLDTELMPWSAKAQSLLKDQYAAVGAAAGAALPAAEGALRAAVARGVPGAQSMLERVAAKGVAVGRYVDAYRQYCWPVDSLDDYRLAPFHLLATEGAVHVGQSHAWHMTTLAEIARADPALLVPTAHRVVDLEEAADYAAAVDWWLALTGRGGEGMVVKPLDFIAYGTGGLLQPAVKCRGREYLRIIYGPEYDAPEQLARLKSRGLARKRSLAVREFALGIEGLERFVRREPLRRVHECVFGVLALESEEVDPRL